MTANVESYTRSRTAADPLAALVLSGGGARGAYAVGVVAGLREALGAEWRARPLFDIFTGTSVGAINAAQLAACADRADMGIPDLVRVWKGLRLGTHMRPSLRRILGWTGKRRLSRAARALEGRSLLDPRPFEDMVANHIPWERLHRNIDRGVVRALLVSALRIADGRTMTFAELAPDARLAASHDPRRGTRIETITADHVLASAALPLLFPARRVGASHFCDGGLRFNTPIAPAIRCGAQKLVIVALRAGTRPKAAETEALEQYPNPAFLLGKILDALLLDPIDYDLQVLERFNRVLDLLAETVPKATREQIGKAVERERGLPYRRLQTLVFRPSEDIGVLAAEYMRSRRLRTLDGVVASVALRWAAAIGANVEADLLSYLLVDGGFADTLIELGRHDALRRADEIVRFFG